MDNSNKPIPPPNSQHQEDTTLKPMKVPAQSRLKEELLKPMPVKNVAPQTTKIIIPSTQFTSKPTSRLAAGTKIILPSSSTTKLGGKPLQFIVSSPTSSVGQKILIPNSTGLSLINTKAETSSIPNRPVKIILSPPAATATPSIFTQPVSTSSIQYIVNSSTDNIQTVPYEEESTKYVIENTEEHTTQELIIEGQPAVTEIAEQETLEDVPPDTDAANSLIAIAEQLQQPKVENLVYFVDDKGDNSGIVAEHAVVGDDIEPAEVEVQSVEVKEMNIITAATTRKPKRTPNKQYADFVVSTDDDDLSDTDKNARISSISTMDHLSYLSQPRKGVVYSPQAKERQAAFTSDESTDTDDSDDDDFSTRDIRVKKPSYRAKKPQSKAHVKSVNSWMKKFVPKVMGNESDELNSDDEDYSDIGVPKEHLIACCEKFRKVTESVEELMRNNSKTRSYRETTNISGDRVFECSTCHKLFTMRDTIKKHLIRHTGQRCFQCTKCNKNFMFKYGLKCHMMTHTGKMPCVCTVCGGKFIENSKLEVHMRRVHTSERPFECAQCDKKYPTKSELNNHILNCHTTIKPYPCPFCDKKFSHDAKLKRHLTVHTGERPFKCSFCEKAFTQRAHLQIHERCHTGIFPYACDGCDKRFYDKVSRDRHYRRIHEGGGEKPLCKICGTYFKTKSNLTRHTKICKRIIEDPISGDEDDDIEDVKSIKEEEDEEEMEAEPKKRSGRPVRAQKSKKLTVKISRKRKGGNKTTKKSNVESVHCEKAGKLFIRSRRVKADSTKTGLKRGHAQNSSAEPQRKVSKMSTTPKRKRRSR